MIILRVLFIATIPDYCYRCKEEINKIKREKLLELSSSLSKENAHRWSKDMNSIPTEFLDDNGIRVNCLLVYVIHFDEYEFGYYYDTIFTQWRSFEQA